VPRVRAGTLEGGCGFLVPLPENMFRALAMLQDALVANTQQLAGLNPLEYRSVRLPLQVTTFC